MQKEDKFALWAAKLENLESGALDKLQEDFEREDSERGDFEREGITVWQPLLPVDSTQEVVEVKVNGEEDQDEEGYQWGELKFSGGEVFQGRFSKDFKNRQGKLYKDARSVKQSFISVSEYKKLSKDQEKLIQAIIHHSLAMFTSV